MDEDEILVTLSEELGGFVPLVGGPEYASCLLDPLEALAAVEETVVRNKVCTTAQRCSSLIIACPCEFLILDTRVLIGGRIHWYRRSDFIRLCVYGQDGPAHQEACRRRLVYLSRVCLWTLCGIVSENLSHVQAKRTSRVRVSYDTILNTSLSNVSLNPTYASLYEALCGDDTPMVRRSAALHLGKFAASVEKEHLVSNLVTHFKTLSADDQDSVRLLAIENCATMSQLLSEDENKLYVLPMVRESVDDRSWRVRNAIAREFANISRAMGLALATSELRANYVSLLQDAEAEVRATASRNLTRYLEVVGPTEFVKHVGPTLVTLVQDLAPNVRSALAKEVMTLAPSLGQVLTSELLVPLYLELLRDEVVEVRLNVLSQLHVLGPWIASMDTTILPAVQDLARDLQWRVREAVIRAFPSLASALGPNYFQEHLLVTYLALMTDLVAEVRSAATCVLRDLLLATGSDWMSEHVVPKLSQTFDSSQIYQERVNVLSAVKVGE